MFPDWGVLRVSQPDARASLSPFGKTDDINSLHFDGYRPSTVQELLMKNKIKGNSPYKPAKQFAKV